MDEFSFELHGVGVQIAGNKPNLLASLARDFAGFATNKSEVRIKIQIVTEIPWSAAGQKGLITVWNGRKVTVKGWWNRRVNLYPTVQAESVTQHGVRYFWIEGTDESAMREVIYKFVLSALGEELELRGYHRVHGCGFEVDGQRYLVCGRSGVGKSSLAAQVVARSWGLFSDESPLVRGRFLFSFPTRLSLDSRAAARLGISGSELLKRDGLIDKVLVPFPLPVPAGGFLGRIYLAEAGSESSVSYVTRIGILGFWTSSVLGLGLAQMSEWMLRGSALPRLCFIFFRRAFAFGLLCFTIQFRKAVFSLDPSSNFHAISASTGSQDDQTVLNSFTFSN